MNDGGDDASREAAFAQVRAALEVAGLPSADFGRFTSGRHPDVIRNSVFDARGSIPVLLSLLNTVFHPDALQAVVAHLATPIARPAAAAPLIALFRTTDPAHSSLKWTIGNALSVVTTPAHTSELLELALDPIHGPGRQMIVDRLGRISDDPRTVEALRSLATDPDVALHALGGLRKRLGPAEFLSIVETLLSHPTEGVRRGAEYTMRKVRRVRGRP